MSTKKLKKWKEKPSKTPLFPASAGKGEGSYSLGSKGLDGWIAVRLCNGFANSSFALVLMETFVLGPGMLTHQKHFWIAYLGFILNYDKTVRLLIFFDLVSELLRTLVKGSKPFLHKWAKGSLRVDGLRKKHCDELFCFSLMHTQCCLLCPFWALLL